MDADDDFIQRKTQSVPQAPEHEIEGTAVPDATHEEGQHVCDDGDRHAALPDGEPVKQANDRLEHVYLQKGGEGDMPPFPEIRDVGRQVRVVEVLGRAYAHHVGHADGQVAVAGEVDVDVQGVEQGGAQHGDPRAHVREQCLVVGGVRQHERHDEQGFHGTQEDAAHASEQHPRVEAHAGGVYPVVEVVERIDGARHEGGKEEQIVDIGEEVSGAQRSPAALHQPMDEAEEDIGEAEFFNGEKRFFHVGGPELAKTLPHERIRAYGKEGDQQREGEGQQPAPFLPLQEHARPVAHRGHDQQDEHRLRAHEVGQYQRVAQQQDHVVQPAFPEHPLAHHENRNEQQDAEKQLAALEEHDLYA